MLQLTEALHEQIKTRGAAAYPYEGCGLLLGRVENGRNVVMAIHPVPNVWPDVAERRVRFRIDPQDWRDAEFAAMGADLDIVGIYHSHPDHPPVASPRDLAWATWPGYSYLITEVRQGQAVGSRSWQLAADRSDFREEDIDLRA